MKFIKIIFESRKTYRVLNTRKLPEPINCLAQLTSYYGWQGPNKIPAIEHTGAKYLNFGTVDE